MRFKVDENIPRAIVDLLVEKSHDIQTVTDEDLVGEADLRVAEAAAREGRIVDTADRGFGDVRLYPPGSHPGIFVVHARELRQSVILMLLATFLVEHDVEGAAAVPGSWPGPWFRFGSIRRPTWLQT